MERRVAIDPLEPTDLAELSLLLLTQRAEYIQYFRPFAFDRATLAAQVSAAVRDRYWGLRSEGRLAGFFMLRGWDQGYRRPAFGVVVAEAFSGLGLAREALNFASEYCRAAGEPVLMLTVHPANTKALRVYQAAGFQATGERSRAGDDIFELHL